jgi:hypothetical protein
MDREAGEGADLLERLAATREPVTDGESRSHPGTDLRLGALASGSQDGQGLPDPGLGGADRGRVRGRRRVPGRHRLAQERGGQGGGRHRGPRRCLPGRPARGRSLERARAYFPATLPRAHRLVGVQGWLRVRRVRVATPSAAPGAWPSGTEVAGLEGRCLARSVVLALERDGSLAGS